MNKIYYYKLIFFLCLYTMYIYKSHYKADNILLPYKYNFSNFYDELLKDFNIILKKNQHFDWYYPVL